MCDIKGRCGLGIRIGMIPLQDSSCGNRDVIIPVSYKDLISRKYDTSDALLIMSNWMNRPKGERLRFIILNVPYA